MGRILHVVVCTPSPQFVAMGAILSFFFPSGDTEPDLNSDTKEDESDVKEVEKEDTKKTPELKETKLKVPKITEEAMEEADYEVVEKTSEPSTALSAEGFPPTPQNSFASLP